MKAATVLALVIIACFAIMEASAFCGCGRQSCGNQLNDATLLRTYHLTTRKCDTLHHLHRYSLPQYSYQYRGPSCGCQSCAHGPWPLHRGGFY